MKIGSEGLDLIKRSEGLRLKAYPDPATGAEPWTIGYGTTANVTPGLVIDQAEAERRLAEACAEFDAMLEDRILRLMPGALRQHQHDALGSFLFNLGPGGKGIKDGLFWLRSGLPSTLYRMVLAEDFRKAADEFPKWANPPLDGLVIRRARERDLFLGRDWRTIPDGGTPGAVAIARAHNAVPA